jgi:amino acid transporter
MENLLQNPNAKVALAGLALVLMAVFAVGAYFAVRKQQDREAELAPRELAFMVEDVRLTAGGVISVLALIVVATGGMLGTINGAIVIGGCILFGVGALLGRRHSYHIYRSEHQE